MKEYTKKAKSFYDSKRWRHSRQLYIDKRVSIDGGMCEHCKQRLGYIVDHIEELNDGNLDDVFISLSHDNLQYLCIECHNKKTHGKEEHRTVRFDSDGNPVFADLPPPIVK